MTPGQAIITLRNLRDSTHVGSCDIAAIDMAIAALTPPDDETCARMVREGVIAVQIASGDTRSEAEARASDGSIKAEEAGMFIRAALAAREVKPCP